MREPLSMTSKHAVGDTVRTWRGDTRTVMLVCGSFAYWVNDEPFPLQEEEVAKPGQKTEVEKRRES